MLLNISIHNIATRNFNLRKVSIALIGNFSNSTRRILSRVLCLKGAQQAHVNLREKKLFPLL
jgi:hypothetical protein